MTACLSVMWEGVWGCWTALHPVGTLSLCDSERPSGCRGEGWEEVLGSGREERSWRLCGAFFRQDGLDLVMNRSGVQDEEMQRQGWHPASGSVTRYHHEH